MKDQTEILEQLCKKLLSDGTEKMTQRELFEMVLLFADRKAELSLRESLLTRYDSLADMLSDSFDALCQTGKHGTVLAGLAKLIRELSPAFGAMTCGETTTENMSYSDRAARYCIANSNDQINKVCKILASRHYNTTREVFRVAFLNNSNHVVGEENMEYGNAGAVYINFLSLFKKAFEYKACGIILVHNHPDGDLTPSQADIQVTERLKDSCENVGIKFVDHIIVYSGKFKSLVRENGSCNGGGIIDMFSSCSEGAVYGSGTRQIGHSGVYRETAPSDFDEEMRERFAEYERSEQEYMYNIYIGADENGKFCFERNLK